MNAHVGVRASIICRVFVLKLRWVDHVDIYIKLLLYFDESHTTKKISQQQREHRLIELQ